MLIFGRTWAAHLRLCGRLLYGKCRAVGPSVCGRFLLAFIAVFTAPLGYRLTCLVGASIRYSAHVLSQWHTIRFARQLLEQSVIQSELRFGIAAASIAIRHVQRNLVALRR